MHTAWQLETGSRHKHLPLAPRVPLILLQQRRPALGRIKPAFTTDMLSGDPSPSRLDRSALPLPDTDHLVYRLAS